MLTVTEAAKAHIADLLQKAEAPDEASVRLVRSPAGIELAIDQEKPGDTSFEHDTSTVLVVGEDVAPLLDQATLDIEQSEQGARLRLS